MTSLESSIEKSDCLCESAASRKFRIRGHNFYKCGMCGLIFVSPRFDATSIYDADYFEGGTHGFGFSNYEIDKLASKGYFLRYLKWLKRLAKRESSNLLDIGAANGFFVALAEHEGFNAQGIEVSASAVEWARRLGRNVSVGKVEESEFQNYFHFVTALDVLEHIEDPRIFLQEISRILIPGGYLLINVPDAGSMSAKITGKKWHALLPPEHWFYFNRKSLRHLLKSHGFLVVKERSISKSFMLSYVLLTIMNSPQTPDFVKQILSKFRWVINSRIGRIKIYLPLFDNLSVVAMKSK